MSRAEGHHLLEIGVMLAQALPFRERLCCRISDFLDRSARVFVILPARGFDGFLDGLSILLAQLERQQRLQRLCHRVPRERFRKRHLDRRDQNGLRLRGVLCRIVRGTF